MRAWKMLLFAAALGCGNGSGSGPGLPKDVTAIVFLQRAARNEGMGNVFDYTGYTAGGRIVKLEPPSPDGKLTVLTSDPMFAQADFMAWDLSFDAKSIVFSARLSSGDRYHVFTMNVDGTNIKQLTEGDNDYVYPIFLPGQKILFMTNKNVEPGTPQFQDEYERQVTAQVGLMNVDGTGETLGPRNVSHRVAPTLLPDGRVLYTEWRHLGDINDGHLRIMNADMTGMREAFGGEGAGVTNSYLKARYVKATAMAGGASSYQIVTIATDRDRTIQSGKLLLVELNNSEEASAATDMTPLIPGGRGPSMLGVGRYYDAEIVGNPDDRLFLSSWADGPVESETLAMARTNANFGLYLFDGKSGKRFPLYDDPNYWDVLARPLAARSEPPITDSPMAAGATAFTVGALDVFDSSLPEVRVARGSAVKVRLIEGFSTEKGFPDMFGLSEFDGQSRLGEVPVRADGSFAAQVPANVPLHLQLIDKFAMAIANEPIWISGRAGEQRFCGGCHESRTSTALIQPGQIEAVLRGADNLDVPRAQRLSTNYSYDTVRGVPWDLALQPIFDAKCISCHDGTANAMNPTYTVMDMTTMTSQTFTFDLRGQKVQFAVGERMTGDFTASHISLLGLGMELGENVTTTTGDYNVYVVPGSARGSSVIEKLNPPQRFPTVDTGVRAYPGAVHPLDVGGQELTPDEYYLLILNIDMGAQFYFRENKGGM